MAKKKYEMQDLSDEDLDLKERLESCVKTVCNGDPGSRKNSLEILRQEIRTSTSSITSVPMPFKFLGPHYGTLKAYYETMAELESDMKKCLADVLSVLAVTMSAEGERESLKYRLLGSEGDIGSWGHAYVRNLAGEIAQEYEKRKSEEVPTPTDDLMELVQQIVAFHMKHNAEPEAVDLILELLQHNAEHETGDLILEFEGLRLLTKHVDKTNYKRTCLCLRFLIEHVDETNYKRTCLYLTSSARYIPEPDDVSVLYLAYLVYLKFEEYPNALRIALRLDKLQYVKRVFMSCNDVLQKKQLCCIIARHGITFELDKEMVGNDDDRIMLQDIINNSKLSEGYLDLARDIEVMEPKSPKDIYKEHLLDHRANAATMFDVDRLKLADTFVNAFVNAGFGQDRLMTVTPDSSSSDSGNWLFKNKELNKTSAAASLGMIFLWDVASGLAQLDEHLHSTADSYATAGALLGVGIRNCNVKTYCDRAMAPLKDYTEEEENNWLRIGAIMGLGIAYAGSQNEQLRDKLAPILIDASATLDVIALTTISLGLIYVGSCNKEVANEIKYALSDRGEPELKDPLAQLLPLGLGLVYLGKKHRADDIIDDIGDFNEKFRDVYTVTVQSCAYAGTGDVMMVQNLLHRYLHHLDNCETHQGPAVLGIAMVAMAEELGLEMAIRLMEHLLQYGEQNIRRAVPLALGLLCISNPKVNVMDTLCRLSRDSNLEVAMAAVISLGLIGAGTNNHRIARILRELSSHYYKSSGLLFCMRIAQGLVHMGKGLLTLNPYHSDRLLLSWTALAGLITMLHACLDMKAIALGRYHMLLYFLVLAMQPRMLMTVDENMKLLPVPVRVGKAVDVAGQAGYHPKTITGFQTLSTPVLLDSGYRAELATEKYIPLSPILEGFVICKENPDYVED